MSHYTQTTAEIAMMFQLKGGLYPLTALQLLGTDLLTFEAQLTAKIAQAPKFFHHAPIVIDLQKLKPDAKIDYQQLVGILQSRHLIPVGVRGGSSEQQTAATRVGLPILQDPPKEIGKTTPPPAHVQETLTKETEIRGTQTTVITEPVRSGQQIYARGGDLVVLAPVSHGAELLADGHIHIYGPLRGRALAGVTGDETAHIFCQHLEAELVSIAGQYQISEDIEPNLWQKATDIALEQGRLHIRLL